MRVAFVMGFGFGKANKEIAELVSRRNAQYAFDLILTQDAVLRAIEEEGLKAESIHVHCAVYVDTVDATGLGVLKVSMLDHETELLDVEIFAHGLQFTRAMEAAERAKSWLEAAPTSPDSLKTLLKRTALSGQPTRPVEMNHFHQVMFPWVLELLRLRITLPQVWTCFRWLYPLAEVLGKKRLAKQPKDYYADLMLLNRQLVEADTSGRVRSHR